RAEGATLAPSLGRATRRISRRALGRTPHARHRNRGPLDPSEAVTRAERSHPFPSRTRSCNAPAPTILVGGPAGTIGRCRPLRRGVEQWQLVGLITRRSPVRIRPPLPRKEPRAWYNALGSFLCRAPIV